MSEPDPMRNDDDAWAHIERVCNADMRRIAPPAEELARTTTVAKVQLYRAGIEVRQLGAGLAAAADRIGSAFQMFAERVTEALSQVKVPTQADLYLVNGTMEADDSMADATEEP